MKKKVIYEHELKKGKLISNGEDALVLKLNNGSILKIFKKETLEIFKDSFIDVESKILSATPIKNSPEILIPTSAAYTDDGKFLGYTMNTAKGINYNLYDKNLTPQQRKDLKRYGRVHSKIESVLRRNKDMVFPDLCTCDNLFVDSKQNIEFIDYDGIQVGKHRTLSLSTALGDPQDIITDNKYFTEELLYTKELDKRSSIILYFLSAFNVDLTKVGKVDPVSGEFITLEHIFKVINLDDLDLCHKVWKIFQSNENNEFLGADVFRIADEYDINIIGIHDNIYLKKLSRKK